MRNLIYGRLEEIRNSNNNFNKSSMRWQYFNVTVGDTKQHISEVNWCDLNDEELLQVFERVIRQINKMM